MPEPAESSPATDTAEASRDGRPPSVINHPASRLPGPGLLHHLVRTGSEDGAPAVDFLPAPDTDLRTVSYSELHRASDLLAARIWRHAGVNATCQQFIVPVLLPQGPELYIALLAILKAGGAFCPLNLDAPLERARFIINDVSATLVITKSELASRIPDDQSGLIIMRVDEEAAVAKSLPDTQEGWRQPQPTDMAYVMYTSGSTGAPKGVGVSHEAATQSLLAHDPHIPKFSRFLQFAAPTFDVSVFEIFFPFFRGKTLVSCTRSAMLNDLPAVIREMEVDACELTPTVAGSLLRKRENAPGLKLLLTIGEMLTLPVVQEFGGGDGKESMLWAMYGPTEAAIHCTVQSGFIHSSCVGDIGVPFDTVSAFVLEIPHDDDAGTTGVRVLPQGEIGELAVGGHQLAQGYINRPEITAKAFVNTPYGRLYRTGDKARIRTDGVLECLGRISEGQVKLRGQRIELGEIEHAALRAAGCHGAFAAVVGNILVLFCAVDQVDGTDMRLAIQGSCTEWLPGFMVPGDIIVAKEFPRLPSGKIDRKVLIAEYSATMGGDEPRPTDKPAFKDELEAQICHLASNILGVDITPSQNLSRAGMDSLVAIKFASALREAGIEVSISDILSSRTVSTLRQRIKESGQQNTLNVPPQNNVLEKLDITRTISHVPVLKGHSEHDIDDILPCTPLQTSMLAETRIHPQAYCNWIQLSFPPEHTEQTILSWFAEIARMNDTLRTGFVHDGERFLQVVFRQLDPSCLAIPEPFDDCSSVKSFDYWMDAPEYPPKGVECSIQTLEIFPDDDLSSHTTITECAINGFEMSSEQDFLRPLRIQITRHRGTGRTTALLQIHHAVYDGWSMDMVLSDLEAISRGELPVSRPPFRQASIYYQSELYQRDCNAAREFWAENLAGFQPPPLPLLTPETPASSEVLSISQTIDISPTILSKALENLEAGPQTIFQAALVWLWGFLVGTDDVVIGTVTSGRTIPVPRIEDVIGPCISSVPLRASLSQVRTVRDLVASAHAANRALLAHSVLPLADIKRTAGLRSGQSAYDLLFVYQESLHSMPDSSRTIWEVSHQDYLETKLLVEVEPKLDSFVCRLTYHSSIFSEDQINILGGAIESLVTHMLNNLDSDMSAVQRAFPPELLSVYNPKPTTFPGIPDLATAVETAAAKFSSTEALCFANVISDDVLTTTTVTFSGLNKTANQVAWLLKQHGAQEDEAVAIVMEKSVLLYAGILGILKAGCAYLPLLPSTPFSRVDTIFRQARVRLCIVDTTTRAAFGDSLSCSLIDIQSEDLNAFPGSNPTRRADPERVSYIIYTSGSTGVPKGVCVTQLNIMSNLDVLSRIYPIRDSSRLLQSCSQAFDVSVFEIFFAWTQGMCLCFATNDVLFADLEQSIRKLRVTHLSMTPTVASLINPANVPDVELLVTSGEAMTEVVARKWARQLYQGYGPSETTNICSVKKMDSGHPIIQHLGWSFENTSTVVLFRDSIEVVPLGCLGELCFGGGQVAQGYLNMPELTASKFINHPQFGRLYRSGDLGRMLPDGSMVITGRVDDQIKIRGQRVELGEISSVVGQCEAVVDCTTLFLKQNAPGTGRIVTFFVPKLGRDSQFKVLDIDRELGSEIQGLFQSLVARVPGYMVPSVIVPVSVLPTTTSGKLDRRRLGATIDGLDQVYLVLASPVSDARDDDKDWSETEIRIAEIVSTTFGVSQLEIRRWTPLTPLGLDSISAIRVSKQIQDKLGKRVAISTILQHASVAKLAEALPNTGMTTSIPAKTSKILPAELVELVSANLKARERVVEIVLPCTPLQEAMLASSTKGSYLNKMLLRVNGDPEKLIRAWKEMCERHGILRTCFVTTEDSRWPIVQAVLDKWDHPWLNLTASDQPLEHYIAQHASTLAHAIDGLEPVVSFAIVTLNTNIYLSFICHHALYDGVAIQRLLFEVEQVISGSELLPPPSYDLFLQESFPMQKVDDGFWLDHLAGYDPKLVTGFKLVDPGSYSLPLFTTSLSIPLSQVNVMVRQLGVSMLAVTQTAWAITLGCLLNTQDICFGNVVSGRSLPIDRLDELVAPCFNTIPVRMDLSKQPRNLDLMKAFHSLNPHLIQHQFTALRRTQSLFFREYQSHRRLFFDTLLILQHPPRPLDQSLWTLERDDGEMDIPLVCEVIPDNLSDLFTIKLHLEPKRFPVELSRVIPDLFSEALRSLLIYPASHVLSLNTIPPSVREVLQRLQFEAASLETETLVSRDGEGWTTTEATIRDVISSLSSSPLHRIHHHTTIYQLGLDSISAVQIASMLRKKGLTILASDVISNPTCQALACHLDAQSPTPTEQEPLYDLPSFQAQVRSQIDAHGIALDSIEAILPCTPLQAGMMTQFIQSGGSDYYNYLDFQMDHSVDLDGVADAWQTLCRLHPILRSKFVPVEHGDCSFALVQFRPDQDDLPLTTFRGEQVKSFNRKKWRLDTAHNTAMTPSGELWSVALTESDQGIMMHLAIHHCLYDAHSLQLLLADLAHAVRGEVSETLSDLQAAITDIIGQISASSSRSAEFWKRQAGRTVINHFPVMTPLREVSRGVLVESTVSHLSCQDLELAAASSGYTLQVILQAAWTRILSSYLGETSVVFGVVLSGRNTEATRHAVFPCISTLPVISTNTASNHDLLQQMLAFNAELYNEQHQPLTRIQQWLGLPDTKLFDTLLVYQKFDADTSETRPWSLVDECATVDYPVSLEVEPQEGGALKYQLTFFSDVLPKEQACTMLQQFDAAVRHLAVDPTGEEDSLIQTFPDLFSMLPPEKAELPSSIRFLHQFVEMQAANIPHRTALHFVDRFDGGRTVDRDWTYSELNNNGNRVAHLILPHVKTGDMVAVYFEKCPEAFFAIMGVLKAGCSFVALDPGAPAARKEFIIQDSGASLVLTSQGKKAELDIRASVPVLSVDEKSLAGQPFQPPVLSPKLEPSAVCYCLYTSGTTGMPKGCEITHDNAVQCMLAFSEIFKGHWSADSRWLQFASLHFDVSVLEQYWSWSVGIMLVGAPRDLILEDLAGTISKLDITHIDLTPSLARLIHPDDVPSLCRGVFITGGESLKQDILDVWGSKAVIYNFYGPTEATIGVTVYPRVPQNGRASNIGRQFVNVGSYVLKPETDIPVFKGGVGELCISGKLVGKGYLGREALTAERFPVLKQFGERVYRTGDLVRVLHDGCFDFLGRADDQVKLRGQRLEIGEINHAIKTGVDEIKDVATIVVGNEKQQKDFLVSFVVTSSQSRAVGGALQIISSPESQALCARARLACQSKLPGYMVPTYIFRLPFIPLSPNNKAEIKVLKSLFKDLSHEELVSVSSPTNGASKTFTESGRKVALVISEMQSLDIQSISPTSSIFELGIDSISVLRFARALKKVGFRQANPSIILRYPVLCDLSEALHSHSSLSAAAPAAAARQLVQACSHRHRSQVCRELGVTPDQIDYIAPCSPMQLGMISRSATDGAYFNTFQFELLSATSTVLMRQAWARVVDTFPILRTVFVKTSDGFVQVALKNSELPWGEVSASDAVEDTLRHRRDVWISENTQQENLTRPLELLLLTGEGVSILVLNIFHGLYDANSLELLLDRVHLEYLALDESRGNGSQATDSPPSFLDALCHGPLQNFTSCKPFWMEHLRHTTFHPLPALSDSAVVLGSREVPFTGLEALRVRLGVTHQSIVQAAWCWTISKHLLVDSTIGVIMSGRNIELDGVEKVVGPLFNTLPFHASVRSGEAGDLSWTSIIRQCHDFNSSVLAFQHVPLRDIQKWCSGGKPLFDILFSFQRNDVGTSMDKRLWVEVPSDPNADYPLALEATLTTSNKLRLFIAGNGGVVRGNDVQKLLDEVEGALDAILKDPDQVLVPKVVGEDSDDQIQLPNGTTSHDGRNENSPISADFAWKEKALVLREEIARLAEVAPEIVSEGTSIFELGLDSIDAIKLSAKLKQQGIKIKTSQLMKAQTVQAIVKLLEHEPKGSRCIENGVPKAASSAHLRELLTEQGHDLEHVATVLPATPLQDTMLVEMIESDFQLYFNHDVLEITPEVDLEKLKEAWLAVIRGSPILRTTFLPTDSPKDDFLYCQIVSSEPCTDVVQVDILGKEDLAKLMGAATQRARKGAGRSDLIQLAIASAAGQRFLILSIAHALYDGRSLDLVHQDVRAAYEGHYTPRQPYESYLEEVIFNTDYDAPGFWSEFLDGAVPTMFPEKTVALSGSVLHRTKAASSLAMSDIKAFCKRHAITMQTLGQACLAALLATRTASLDVTFGLVLSGRDSEYAQDLMFPTMNTVAMRSVLHGTVSSWLHYMQESTANIAPFQHFPLRKAQKLAGCANGPLFNTLFIQQRRPEVGGTDQGDQILKSIDGSSAIEYPVCVEMEVGDGSLVWRTACDGRYVSRDETPVLLHQLDVVLRFLVNSPEAEILSFSGQNVSICGLPKFLPRSTKRETAVNGSSGGMSDTAWSPEEQTIRKVLADVSGVTKSSILKTHNIYNLGLDSISAMRLTATLRKKGLAVKLRDILRSKSIHEMAKLVRAEANGVSHVSHSSEEQLDADDLKATQIPDLVNVVEDSGLSADHVEQVLPATAMQVHTLSVWQNTKGVVFYPEFTYRLSVGIDMDDIGTAWERLVTEVPVLRTLFLSTKLLDVPIVQIVVRPSILEKIVSSSPESSIWCYQLGEIFKQQPFHSVTVTRDTNGQLILRLKIHHALYDAVRLPLILDRFIELCSSHAEAGLINESLHLPSAAARTDAIRPANTVALTKRRHKFWTEYLDGSVSTPFCHKTTLQPLVASRVSLVQQSAISSISRLRTTCEANSVSIQAFFLAAYAKFMASRSSSAVEPEMPPRKDVVFGVYLANRTELDDTADLSYYPTLCLVPLRAHIGDGKSLVEVAAQIQEDIHAISAPENVGVALWELKEWTGVVVDSFVNFLSFPVDGDYSDGGKRAPNGANRVTLEQVTNAGWDEGNGERKNGGHGHVDAYVEPPELKNNRVRDAYVDAVDIEVSLQGDSMIIGVFGSCTKVGGVEGASEVVSSIVEMLAV